MKASEAREKMKAVMSADDPTIKALLNAAYAKINLAISQGCWTIPDPFNGTRLAFNAAQEKAALKHLEEVDGYKVTFHGGDQRESDSRSYYSVNWSQQRKDGGE